MSGYLSDAMTACRHHRQFQIPQVETDNALARISLQKSIPSPVLGRMLGIDFDLASVLTPGDLILEKAVSQVNNETSPDTGCHLKVQGGKSVYGASVGILMLDARFPRIPGDMGHAQTWDFPVHYRVVKNASPDAVVRKGAKHLFPDFVAAAQDLVACGADGITTNCGFLSLFQAELAATIKVPVAASSLMQVNMVKALLPPERVPGILTISASSLTAQHLEAANVPLDTPIGTTEGMREFTRAILGNENELDICAAKKDNVDAAQALINEHPNVGAIVLECTNMVPYASAIQRATGVPVFSMFTFVNWFQCGLTPRRFNYR